ncbi:MAG TPA: hypothetical protein DCY62_02485, partial [Thalassospira sp.]|nr:hypothetical protein [Thalassospira sp.]
MDTNEFFAPLRATADDGNSADAAVADNVGVENGEPAATTAQAPAKITANALGKTTSTATSNAIATKQDGG